MKTIIVFDSGPLGLLMQRQGILPADECRAWLAERIQAGCRFVVPEIADYEVRRELIRIRATSAITRLDRFNSLQTFTPLTTAAMRMAAELWATARAAGKPTADKHALDGDAILAAQVITAGLKPTEFVVASTNVSHISRFVSAEVWHAIK